MLWRLIIVISMLFLFFLDCSAFKLFSSEFFSCSRLQKKNFFWKKRLLTGRVECNNKIRHTAHKCRSESLRWLPNYTGLTDCPHTLFTIQWLQNKFTFITRRVRSENDFASFYCQSITHCSVYAYLHDHKETNMLVTKTISNKLRIYDFSFLALFSTQSS